jgi:hypothetical protein
MERRRSDRTKRRLTCGVSDGERVHRGIVLDLSSGGLFVQTPATIQPGALVVVEFSASDGRPAFSLQARVRRRRRVPQNLLSLGHAGVGLQAIDPPPEFEQLRRGAALEALAPELEEDEKQEPPGNRPRFRVRLRQAGSPRTRALLYECNDEVEALRRARRQCGPDWDVLEVEILEPAPTSEEES